MCYFPCTQREMSDKTATVCPACLLYLNVCIRCQFTLSPQQTAGEWKDLQSHDMNVDCLTFTKKKKKNTAKENDCRIKCTDCIRLSDSYISFYLLQYNWQPALIRWKECLLSSKKSYWSIFLSPQNMPNTHCSALSFLYETALLITNFPWRAQFIFDLWLSTKAEFVILYKPQSWKVRSWIFFVSVHTLKLLTENKTKGRLTAHFRRVASSTCWLIKTLLRWLLTSLLDVKRRDTKRSVVKQNNLCPHESTHKTGTASQGFILKRNNSPY